MTSISVVGASNNYYRSIVIMLIIKIGLCWWDYVILIANYWVLIGQWN